VRSLARLERVNDHPERQRRARELFEALRAQPQSQRDVALTAACTDDAALFAEVTRLLAAADAAGSFLEGGAVAALAAPGLVGRTLGVFEVTGLLGVGGMGEVYRARDVALRRDVALKTLSAPFTEDPARVARLKREAQILASLDHPNIAGIHGLDESQGVTLLVMELVEGPTLSERLAHGPLPLEEFFAVARQIAAALGAAHALGVVHRDLKPANVKLRADGVVKVLDFGLARTVPADGDRGSHSDANLTQAGMILGTARCMSPEQAKGRVVDKRTDIWAYGCILFEMLTGRAPFAGEDVADTLAAILTREPDWNLLPRETPAAVRRLLRRCLTKDREQRLADIADARLELDDAAESPAPPAPAERRRAAWLPWAVALAAVAVVTTAWFTTRHPEQTLNVYRSTIPLPERLGGHRNANGPTLALSPDGRQLAFVTSDANSHTRLWVRALDATEARPLADTRDGQSPFWSPDSRWLAFVQDRHLKKVDVATGAIVTLCDDVLLGGAWSELGVLLFTQASGQLAAVPASGGAAVPLATIDNNDGEVFNINPFFLPDQRRFGYVTLGAGSVHPQLYIASLDAGVAPRRVPIESPVVQLAGEHLWFVQNRTLVAQAFDALRATVSGPLLPVAEQVRINNWPFKGGAFSVSSSGALVFQRDPNPGFDLVWYDRAGKFLGTLGTPADYADVHLSPDGTRALVSVAPQSTSVRDLYIFDIARGLRTRFTFDDTHTIRNAIWTPDGAEVVYSTERNGRMVFMRKAANGTSAPTVLLDDDIDKEALDFTPDGRYLLFSRRPRIATPENWVLPMQPGGKPFRLEYPGSRFASVSPDGRWVAFLTRESERGELFVAPFPGPGRKWLITHDGALNARWRADGRELFFLAPTENKLMSAEITLHEDRVEIGAVRPLFDLPWVGPRFTHDVTADGQRILAIAQLSPATAAPLTLVVNWRALLRAAEAAP
jgi:serine/threonine protein kinase/Tol biopolymer transport system component